MQKDLFIDDEASWEQHVYPAAQIFNATITGVRLTKKLIQNAAFHKCTLRQCQFLEADLDFVAFEDCTLFDCAFIRTKFNNVMYSNGGLERTQFTDSVFNVTTFTRIVLSQTQFVHNIVCGITFDQTTLYAGLWSKNNYDRLILQNCALKEHTDLPDKRMLIVEDNVLTQTVIINSNPLPATLLTNNDIEHCHLQQITIENVMLKKYSGKSFIGISVSCANAYLNIVIFLTQVGTKAY